jgi:hypothetical protein
MNCKEEGRRSMMKNKIVGIAIAMVLTMAVLVSPVMAGDYLGQFCFEATDTTSNTTYMMKLGIADMGGSHFQVAGLWYGTPTNPTPMNGNAEIINGDDIEFTLTYAYFDSDYVYSRLAHMQLDSSLNGYIRADRVYSGPAPQVTSYRMPVAFVPCE